MDCPNLNSKGEDNRLNNWKKWIEIRKQFHQRMFDLQSRRPSELVLNSFEDYRTINEVKLLHEYTRIPEVFSNRGKPSFWSLPLGSKKFPSLLSVMPKQLDFEVPERTTAGVPTIIQQEKNVLTGETPKHSKWFKNEYLEKRSKQLQNDIKRIAPHIPNTENLIITGAPYSSEKEKKKMSFVNLNDKINDESRSESKSSVENPVEITPVKSLQVDGAKFTADGSQEIKKYLVFINYEIGKNDIVSKSVFLNNIGNVALRYHWDRHLPKKVLQDIIPRRLPMYGFIFSKRQSIILPGHTKELKIAFKTNIPGMYKEIWELRTEPNVFDGKVIKGEFFLVLHACAEISNFFESETAILYRIEEGMKYTAVEEALLNILQRTKNRTEEIDQGQKVTEKDLFEAANAEFGPPGTLPLIYHYNEEIVKKLKNIYDAIKTDDDPPIWNYKIKELENLISACNKKERNYFTFTFNDLIKNIFKTNMIENEERDKHQNVYLLLCIMIDQMTEKIYALRNKLQIPLIETYPAVDKEILLKQEYLDNNFRSNLYFTDFTAEAAVKRIEKCKTDEFETPPLEVLKSIPLEDIAERYKIYQKEKYGIDVDKIKEDNEKKGKGKGGKKEKTKKVKKEANEKKGVKEKGDKTKTKKVFERKESIYKDNSITNFQTSKIEIVPEFLAEDYEEPFETTLRMYHYNLYTTIYLLLSQTANEIECILENMKNTKTISRQVLRKCIELGIPTMPSPYENITEQEFKVMLDDIESISAGSISDSSIAESVKTGILSDISKSYSDYDQDFFKPISSAVDIIQEEVEMVDAQTETDGDELFPPKIRTENIQTDECKEEFDLIAQIERELSATSVQYMKKSTENKATQVEICTECILPEQISIMTETLSYA